jgi:hypothetical protein
MNSAGKPTSAGAVDSVACLVRDLKNLEGLATIFEHLWHEGKVFQTATTVECRKDLFLAAYLHPISNTKAHLPLPRDLL